MTLGFKDTPDYNRIKKGLNKVLEENKQLPDFKSEILKSELVQVFY